MRPSSATYVVLCIAAVSVFSGAALAGGVRNPRAAGGASGGDVLCVAGPQNDAFACAGTAGNGIYRSTVKGTAWVQSNVREGAVYALLADPVKGSGMFAATSGGLLSSLDSGKAWETVSTVFRPRSIAITTSAIRMLLGADGTTARRSDDNGKTWAVIEQLSSFGITSIMSVRTDTGHVFFGANDTTVLMANEKRFGVWMQLPALPGAGGAAPRITALMVDTLSLDGTRLVAATSNGVYAYVFHTGLWIRFGGGLPATRYSALGMIVYDTTRATRSYSYCAAIGHLAGEASTEHGLFKISSRFGIISSADTAKNFLTGSMDVRSCFTPALGSNHNKIYLGSDDGVLVSDNDATTWDREVLEVRPIAVITSTSYNAGIVGIGSDTTLTIRIGYRGEKRLSIDSIRLTNTKNFTLTAASGVVANDSLKCIDIPVRFTPDKAGKDTATCKFRTTDPWQEHVSIALTGFCTGAIAGPGTTNRTVVIDRMHSGGADITAQYSDLASALRLAGMSVIEKLPASSAAPIAMVVLPGSTVAFTPGECSVLAGLAAAGTTIVALGSAADNSGSTLNALFAQPQWDSVSSGGTPMQFFTAVASSPWGPITASRSTAAQSLAYLGRANTLAFGAATGVKLTGARCDTLFTAYGLATNAAAGSANGSAILAGVTRMGLGKVIAIGDARFWANSVSGDVNTGLCAADNFSFALSVAGTIERVTVRLADTTVAEKYTLFSVPYALADNSVASALSSLGKPDPYTWRLFGSWNETSNAYAEYPSAALTTIERGSGYWLITNGKNALTLGTADYSAIPEPFTITLKPGFTLIGDPFPFAIDWKRAMKPASVDNFVWAYTDTVGVKSDSLNPFKGYFVCNNSDSDAVVTMYPEPLAASSRLGKSVRAAVSAADGEWSMRVSASDGKVTDAENYFGMLTSASAAADLNDFAEPPAMPGRYVALSFSETGRRALAGDFHAVGAGGGYWDCSVRASQARARISLRLTQLSTLPAGYGVYILDRVTERITDCSQSGAYEFTLGKDEARRDLRILVGEQRYIEQHTDGVPLTPFSYALEQNYPNPWNPSTTIRYTVGHSGVVALDVFNVLGQKIKALVHEHRALGAYEEQWNGTSDSGVEVPSGVYFYRLTTADFAQTKRMVLVR